MNPPHGLTLVPPLPVPRGLSSRRFRIDAIVLISEVETNLTKEQRADFLRWLELSALIARLKLEQACST